MCFVQTRRWSQIYNEFVSLTLLLSRYEAWRYLLLRAGNMPWKGRRITVCPTQAFYFLCKFVIPGWAHWRERHQIMNANLYKKNAIYKNGGWWTSCRTLFNWIKAMTIIANKRKGENKITVVIPHLRNFWEVACNPQVTANLNPMAFWRVSPYRLLFRRDSFENLEPFKCYCFGYSYIGCKMDSMLNVAWCTLLPLCSY